MRSFKQKLDVLEVVNLCEQSHYWLRNFFRISDFGTLLEGDPISPNSKSVASSVPLKGKNKDFRLPILQRVAKRTPQVTQGNGLTGSLPHAMDWFSAFQGRKAASPRPGPHATQSFMPESLLWYLWI
jgi:hypothetical protein